MSRNASRGVKKCCAWVKRKRSEGHAEHRAVRHFVLVLRPRWSGLRDKIGDPPAVQLYCHGIGARRVERPVRKPRRKNQSYDGRLTGPTPSDSARRDLSISAIKKFDNFRPDHRTAPMKSTPNSVRKPHTMAPAAPRSGLPQSLSARRRRRFFWPRRAAGIARRCSAVRCSKAPALSARWPPRRRAAPGERGERAGRPVAG